MADRLEIADATPSTRTGCQPRPSSKDQLFEPALEYRVIRRSSVGSRRIKPRKRKDSFCTARTRFARSPSKGQTSGCPARLRKKRPERSETITTIGVATNETRDRGALEPPGGPDDSRSVRLSEGPAEALATSARNSLAARSPSPLVSTLRGSSARLPLIRVSTNRSTATPVRSTPAKTNCCGCSAMRLHVSIASPSTQTSRARPAIWRADRDRCAM